MEKVTKKLDELIAKVDKLIALVKTKTNKIKQTNKK